MPWPFKARPPLEPCFPIGQYKIDDTTDRLQGLSPLSPAELKALNTAVQFKGEQILHAPDADFVGLKWDTILGTVNDVVYKIAIQWTGPRAETGKIYVEILRYCTKLYGEGKTKKLTLWDASDGNVVLDSTNVGPEGILNLFVTSRQVSQFRRIP
jgi:hypothetical protein